MKYSTSILFCLLLWAGCKNEAPTKANKSIAAAKNISSKIENFDCATFFKMGDYSSICFINTQRPKFNGAGCIYAFIHQGDKQEQSIKLQFTAKKSAILAEMHFNLDKNNYKKGAIIDVANLGDAAFFDVHGTDLKSLSRSQKDLHVYHKNIVFVIMADYQSNTTLPCFFKDQELIAFAKKIIENL